VTIHTLDEFGLDPWMVLETKEYCAFVTKRKGNAKRTKFYMYETSKQN
jgi:hypothetical protein